MRPAWRTWAPAGMAALLLAGCSTQVPRPPVTPPPPVVATAPAIPAPTASASVPVPVSEGFWAHLRSRFAMHDCVAPAVRRAHRETRNPARFQKRIRALLPVIDYVQEVAARHDVAGEFVLLPWVESHFHETPPRRHRAAGMWQIMPVTARALHLEVGRHYDGRLDKTASTQAVMRLLARYHKRWHDWRLADMAYNTGAYRMRRILKAHGMPPATPVIPDLPVGRTTRNHLTRLLAIACIIRDPQRFHVRLPAFSERDRLQVVDLPAATSLRRIAHLLEMPEDRLRRLNAGYRTGQVPRSSPRRLLLPADAAQSLREAIASGLLQHEESLALAASASGSSGLPDTYTVVSGDSLWSIARRFDLQVTQLRDWNDLAGTLLHPGQVLQLGP